MKIKECFSGDVFRTTPRDEEVGLSWDDRSFLNVMNKGINKNADSNWELPLPFRREEPCMPNNKTQAVKRLNGLIRTLEKKPQMERDYVDFMKKVFDKGHASPVLPAETKSKPDQVWYLLHFGVYHPKKPEQVRVVFDSSAEWQGTSLNKELLAGPDLINSLIGVLVRFRTK